MTTDRQPARGHGCRLLLLLLWLFAAWPAAAADPIVLKASSSNFGSAVLELHNDELVTMTQIPFRLRLFDDNGQPLAGAAVRCEMDMPSMTMPENRPQVFVHDDAYLGEMIFTCAMGAWRISFSAEHTDGRRQSVSFYVESVRMR